MKISQEIRDAAAGQNDVAATTAVEAGLAEMAEKFREGGGEILVKV
jgi:phosphomethylpyrimidine synthase